MQQTKFSIQHSNCDAAICQQKRAVGAVAVLNVSAMFHCARSFFPVIILSPTCCSCIIADVVATRLLSSCAFNAAGRLMHAHTRSTASPTAMPALVSSQKARSKSGVDLIIHILQLAGRMQNDAIPAVFCSPPLHLRFAYFCSNRKPPASILKIPHVPCRSP